MTFTASAAYPYPAHRERVTAGLRAQLRGNVASAAAGMPDWSTLAIDGPTQAVGRHGVVWYQWTATVEATPAATAGRGSSAR